MTATALKLYLFSAADATLHIIAYALPAAMATYYRIRGGVRAHKIEIIKEF